MTVRTAGIWLTIQYSICTSKPAEAIRKEVFRDKFVVGFVFVSIQVKLVFGFVCKYSFMGGWGAMNDEYSIWDTPLLYIVMPYLRHLCQKRTAIIRFNAVTAQITKQERTIYQYFTKKITLPLIFLQDAERSAVFCLNSVPPFSANCRFYPPLIPIKVPLKQYRVWCSKQKLPKINQIYFPLWKQAL